MRNLLISDAAIISEIHKKCFNQSWSTQEFAEMLSNKAYFGFYQKSGFILCRRILNEIEIITFGVSVESRNKGLGYKLLQAVIDYSLADDIIFLEVSENNSIAKHLYLKVGFEQIGIRKNYYNLFTRSENAFVMKYLKTLQTSIKKSTNFSQQNY